MKKNRGVNNVGFFILSLFILSAAVFYSGKGLFQFQYYYTHDGLFQIFRSMDAIGAIQEMQLPLRWAGFLNYFCGIPVFNFYYPLIYYLVYIGSLFSENLYFIIKVISFLSLFSGTIFFYLWIRSEIKDDILSLGSALLYLFVPYRFLLVYVRGTPEYLSYAIFPAVLYFFSLYLNAKDKKVGYLFAAAVSLSLLFISHNIAALFLVPVVFVYLLIKFIPISKNNIKEKLPVIISFFSSIGLSAFFLLPALMEKQYVKLGIFSTVDYQSHFVSLMQLIRSTWGYGYSMLGPDDGMSFMLGYAQWIILGLSLLGIVLFLRRKKIQGYLWELFLILLTIMCIFLMLPESEFLWKLFPLLQQAQYPWRLLGVTSFSLAVLFPLLLLRIGNKYLKFSFLGFVVLLAIVGNRNNIKALPVYDYVYEYADPLHHPLRFSTSTINDEILSINALERCSYYTPIVKLDGAESIRANYTYKGTSERKIDLNIGSKIVKNQQAVLALSYFPGQFKLILNNKEIHYSDCNGRVCFDSELLNIGRNTLSWRVVQTPLQKAGNIISLCFLSGWIIFLIIRGRRKDHE